jgi:hypothetical protein
MDSRKYTVATSITPSSQSFFEDSRNMPSGSPAINNVHSGRTGNDKILKLMSKSVKESLSMTYFCNEPAAML